MNKKGEKIVAIIPARGGSKSIPRKNVLPFHGKPLIAWPIELAQSVDRIDRVIVTTEDDEIAAIAKEYGAEVPFKRPAELADDHAATLPVLKHCVNYLITEEQYTPDIIVLLYATSPLLKKERVEEAMDLFETTDCNTVLGVTPDWRGHWVLNPDLKKYTLIYPKKRLNRQEMPPIYREVGAVSFSRTSVIQNQEDTTIDINNTEFVVFGEQENIDIDNPEDFAQAAKIKNS